MTKRFAGLVNLGVLKIVALTALPGCYVSPRPATMSAGGGNCATKDFAAVQLQHRVRPSIVRIESDSGTTGTGFVVNRQRDSILIATNYHVLRTGKKFDVIFDSGARLGSVEVVKIDIDQDLALLKAPRLAQPVPGLVLSSRPVALAEHVAAIGYPVVAGESPPSLTFEDGSVTNVATELEGRTYIRTNANINPGNSGGPVIDGCAQVVGIVVATATETKRTGLVIPIDALRTLVAAHEARRQAPETEVSSRISTLETAIRYRRGADIANTFSRAMLSERATEAFVKSLGMSMKAAGERINALLLAAAKSDKPWRVPGTRMIITDWQALPSDMRAEAISAALDDREKQTLAIAMLVYAEKIDIQTATVAWLGDYVQELFGENPRFKIDRIRMQGRAVAHTEVMVGSAEAPQFWKFDWIYEWGDWRIDSISCERGCR